MKTVWMTGMPALLAVALTACASSGGSAASPASSNSAVAPPVTAPPATAAPAASTVSASAGSAGAAAATTDPCKLVTQSEASALTGVSYGPGREESEPGTGGERRCIYGYQTTNVLTVAVVRAASVAQARSQKNALLAQAQQVYRVLGRLP